MKHLSAAVFLSIAFASPTFAQPSSLGNLQTLMSRFQAEMSAGESKKAAATIAEIIPIGERIMGPGSPDVIRLGITRGVLLRNQGEYDAASVQLNKSLTLAKNKLGAKHAVTASAWSTLGTVYRLQGDFPQARQHYEQAIRLLEQLGPDAIADRADAYANFSDLLSETGDPAGARKYIEDAIKLNEQKFGRRSVQTAACINNLGMLLLALGQNAEAETTLRDSLVLHQRIHGKEHPEVALSWNNLGQLLVARGQYDEATASYKAALDIAKTKLGKEHPTTLSVQNNLGQLYTEVGDLDNATQILQQVVQLQTKVLGSNHPSTNTTMHNLGSAYAFQGEFEKASPILNASAEYFETDDTKRLADASASRAFLGLIEANTKNIETAIQQLTRSRQTANDAAWYSLPKLSNNQQQKFMQTKFNWTLYLSLSLAFIYPDNDKVLSASAEWLANGKGIATEALVAARSKKSNVALTWVKLEELRAAIPPNAVWIDITRQDFVDFQGKSLKEQLKAPRYVAWVVPKSGPVSRCDLGVASNIDKMVDEVREAMGSAGGRQGSIAQLGEIEATAQVNAVLTKIGNIVWKPLQETLPQGTNKVLLSPDSNLWLLPWAALPVSDDQVFIQRYALSTYGSGRMLCAGKQQPPKKTSKSAVFSNPEFDQTIAKKRAAYQAVFKEAPKSPMQGQRSFAAFDRTKLHAPPLPGTEIEAAAVEPSITKWLHGTKPLQYRGTYAMESIAKKLVSPRTLVFATHGFFSDDKSKVFDPLLRCGLLLSGCNVAKSVTAEDDGILTGSEIADMNLHGTELVVLSACETGIGRIENGNGVAGLRRAFHLAGAQAVVSTLWQIPDIDSAKLMGGFFSEIAEGNPKDEALRAAQLKRIESRQTRNGAAHPFFWAAYGLSGRSGGF